MGRSSIKDQLCEVKSAIRDFPEYSVTLQLHMKLLQELRTLDESTLKGARDAMEDSIFKSLQERAVASKKPIICFLEPSKFDTDVFLVTTLNVIKCLMDNLPAFNFTSLKVVYDALEDGEIIALEVIKALLEEDADFFEKKGDKIGVDPSFLVHIFETPLRPFFEELARRVDKETLETWWEPFCPVCGRNSFTAKTKDKKRFMICPYCGAEYLVDIFLCIHCGNKDPYTMGFMSIEGYPEFEINYCTKCKQYIKVLDIDRMEKKFPGGLEDILTGKMDSLARGKKLGLKRS